MEGGNKVVVADLGESVLTDQCPLYRADGKDVVKYLDKKVEAAYYVLLDKATKGSKTLRKDFGVAMNAEEMTYWDKDDPYDMGGYNCFLPDGNGRLVHALAENVPILFEKLFIPFVMVEIV
ncbi:hypothetical protein KY290_025473 [Solanum tuberosum]|uniref:Uncharacterized protein n=1 Tax=Solanum tuberosum TaxID=4113 RepID=A0ABQ7UUW2_SOLTU|nr:hypothetical protein KY290_025473 [Solanum tuberosum]